MVTLGEFTGLLMADFMTARRMSDACCTAISEEYHVNPLLQGMPVPRYIIDEAEIDVPLQIAGVQKSEFNSADKKKLIQKIDQYLPTLLYRNIKNSYYDKEEYRVWNLNKQPERDTVGIDGIEAVDEMVRLSNNPLLRACYKASTVSICYKMSEYMCTYVDENTVSEMKLLDFTDAFIVTLQSVIKKEFSTYLESETPFIDKEALKKACQIIGNAMFFEFKDVFQQTEGVLVVPETNKLENNISSEQLMRVKIKIKEQDVEFVVDQDQDTGEVKRFISLN
jgi:hypothetical protein